jgi:hypothetical protein
MDEQKPSIGQEASTAKDQIELKKLEMWTKALDKADLLFQWKMAELNNHDVPVSKQTLSGLFWMTALIVVVVTVLMILGKLSESAFTFVMGTLLGFIVAMGKSFFGTNGE